MPKENEIGAPAVQKTPTIEIWGPGGPAVVDEVDLESYLSKGYTKEAPKPTAPAAPSNPTPPATPPTK